MFVIFIYVRMFAPWKNFCADLVERQGWCKFKNKYQCRERSEVIRDVEDRANLLRSLSLQHVRHILTTEVKQAFDVEIISSQDEIEKSVAVDARETSIERLEIFVILILSLSMFLAVLNDLSQDMAGNVRDWDFTVGAIVLYHVLDRLRLQGHSFLYLENLAVRTLQHYHL